MTATDIVILSVIAAIIGAATWYVIKAKRSGKKCIGCPDSGSCTGGCCGCNTSGESYKK